MEKSIMALADDILGGALTNPAKAPSALSNPYNEPELPELSDELREGMIAESVNEKLGPELSKHKTTRKVATTPMGRPEPDTSVKVSSDDREKLSAQAKAKLKSHQQRKSSRDDSSTSWAVERPRDDQRASWKKQREREAAHKAARGQRKVRGAKPADGGGNREMLLKKKREAEEKRRRSQGVQRRKPAMENSNLQLLLRARDLMREMTGVGSLGTGPSISAGRVFRTNAAPMGKDNIPIQKSKESPKTNAPKMKAAKKKKDDKKKKKKLKKESYEFFLDAVVNEAKGAN